MDLPPEERVIRSDGGIPICCVLSRYFWLCERCFKVFVFRRWTADGVVLERHVAADDAKFSVVRDAPSRREAIDRAA